ncbi:MAG: AAA family ATPase [Planctomycetota bacterium]
MTRKPSSQELALYQQQLLGALRLDEPEARQDPTGESLVSLIDDRLRGRWRYMFILGGGLALVLLLLGWRSTEPLYRSVANVQVITNRDVIMTALPEHVERNPGKFKITQMELIRSRRVLEEALRDESLKRFSWTSAAGAVERLEHGLIIDSSRNSDLIAIAYEAGDPETAQIATNAVLDAYYDIYGDQGGADLTDRLQRLHELAAKHDRDLRLAREDMQRITARHGTNDLAAIHREKIEMLTALEGQIRATQLIAKRLEEATVTDPAAELPPPPLPTLEQFDARLAELRVARDQEQTEFEIIRRRYREGSAQYRIAEQRANDARAVFEAHYFTVLDQWRRTGGVSLPDGMAAYYEGQTPERLQEEIDGLRVSANELRDELQQMLADMQTLENNRFERERIQGELERTRSRIQNLETERDNITNVVMVAQRGFKPHGPFKDSRKKRAAAGFMGGFIISFSLFYLVGTIDRRTFGARQLRASGSASMKCLGVLPDLGESITDPESSELASHCVHQIRNQIEATRRHDNDGFVIAVSSPFQGDGKTSICMALGWSYAAAGHRTCLVDCDLVGRSLTRQLGLVGEAGVRESVSAHTIDGRICSLPVEHLDALPVGVDPNVGPESLRRAHLTDIFDQLRDRYEVIIVDTGPLLGSLESMPVTASADGVVFSVRRGRSRSRLDECVSRLESVGATCLGVILNCAQRGDVVRYVSEASLLAAEERAHDPAGELDESSIIRVSPNERNALLSAMETSAKTRQTTDDHSLPKAS